MKRLDRLLGESLDQREIVRAAEAWQALHRWPEVVGAALAQKSWPDRFEHGTVYVAVDGSAWAQELRMLKPVILERLGELLRNRSLFQDVRFGVRPLPERRLQATARPTASKSEENAEDFEAIKHRLLNRPSKEE